MIFLVEGGLAEEGPNNQTKTPAQKETWPKQDLGKETPRRKMANFQEGRLLQCQESQCFCAGVATAFGHLWGFNWKPTGGGLVFQGFGVLVCLEWGCKGVGFWFQGWFKVSGFRVGG